MLKSILDVKPGDIIVEGKTTTTTVTKVDTESCKNKVHINDKDCYEVAAVVQTRDGSSKSHSKRS